MRTLVFAAAVAALSCGGPSGQLGSRPSWREQPAPVGREQVREARPIVLRPAGQPSAHYNAPRRDAAPESALAAALDDALGDASAELGVPRPVADARLFRVAGDLASIASHEAPMPYSVVEFSMRHHGIIEPSPHLITIWASPEHPEPIMAELRPRLPEILRGHIARFGVGSARTDTGPVIVLAFQPSFLTTNPIPRQLERGGSFELRAEIADPFRDPKIFITHRDGSVVQPRSILHPPSTIVTDVRCDFQGVQRVEVTARDAGGSTVLANFPVWCGEHPPDSIEVSTVNDGPASTEAEAQRQMFEMVNRDRAEAGLPPLQWDDRLVEVARAHSAEMYRTGNVVHVSPVTGSAADRVAAAGVKTPLVLENVARAYSVSEAQEGLMNSPGHRANLLAREATHIGVGIVFGEGEGTRREMFVTQVFMRVPQRIDPGTARDQLDTRARKDSTLQPDAQLADIAQRFAEDLASGLSAQDAATQANVRLDHTAGRFRKATTIIASVAEPAEFDMKELARHRSMTHYGLGVAQGKHPVIGDNAIYIVVVVAQAAR